MKLNQRGVKRIGFGFSAGLGVRLAGEMSEGGTRAEFFFNFLRGDN